MAHLGFAPEFPPSKLLPLIEEVTSQLKGRNETVSVAETVSCISIYCLFPDYYAPGEQASYSMNIAGHSNMPLCCLHHACEGANW